MKRLAPALVLSLVALLTPSCGKPGPGNLVILTLDGGLPQSMVDPGGDSWESSPWYQEGVSHWLPYGPHEQLQVQHALGRMPTGVITYISFVESGQNPSQAAGDLARVIDVTPDHVTVWNDTNGVFFARIVVF